jgi:hypothetical protein
MLTSGGPLIAVVHTTTASIKPTADALALELPGARVWNLLDDRLGPDADELGAMSPRLRDRMLNLVRHGVNGGADAALMVCSMYGDAQPVAEKLFSVPVVSSDSDMMAEIARVAPRRVAVLASLRAAVSDTATRLTATLAGTDVEVVPAFCPGAAEAAAAGDASGIVEALLSGLAAAGGPFDMACIAQYSLSPAAEQIAARTGLTVVSPPRYAARAIARSLSSP